MIDWALTDEGDLTIPSRLVRGHELVLQRIRIRLRTHEGDWVLDPSVGGAYARWRATKPIPVAEVVQWVRQEIVSTPGVLRELGMAGGASPDGSVLVRGRFLLAPLDSLSEPTDVEIRVAGVGNAQPAVITFHRIV